LLGKLEVWGSGFDAHLLCLITAGYYAAVVVAQHNNGLIFQVGAKNTLTTYIAVIAVNDAVHAFPPYPRRFASPKIIRKMPIMIRASHILQTILLSCEPQ
jgi:hypothetical protein